MKKIRLEIEDVTQGVSGKKPFFLMLREAEGHRKLSVMVGPFEAQAILVKLRGVSVPRPLLHDAFIQSLDLLGVDLREVYIYKVSDGVFYSSLLLVHEGVRHEVDARTSDAIALALRYDAPIYTSESLLVREQILDDGNGAISIPVSSVGVDVLREALERAIREERYELAAQLRDEISRREGKVDSDELQATSD
ncbi:MAG: bifunctional nuclease family protein [Bacteroidaceae bacterium]|nr:bifunctional nuclease family protein [Bacteroidaceae bacterium]